MTSRRDGVRIFSKLFTQHPVKMRKKNGQFRSKLEASRSASLDQINEGKKTKSPQSPWLEGRRVIEFEVLLNGLKKCGNTDCGNRLTLFNIVWETIYGLGSILHITCDACRTVNMIPTGKRHSASENSTTMRCFDVNTKLAMGKYSLNF